MLSGTRGAALGRLRRAVAAATALGALLAAVPASQPVRAARAPFVNIWVPYWDASAGSKSYGPAANAALYRSVSPFSFQAGVDGSVNVVGGLTGLNKATTTARANGLAVIPTVTDGAGKLGMQAILLDPARRAAHVAALVAVVVNGVVPGGTGPYDGIDLDYENFAFTDGSSTWATTQPAWVQFVADLRAALPAGKVLSVTIPPTWNATSVTDRKDYWVYAQDLIAPYVDRLRLMVYDWSPGTPSATAPIDWVGKVVRYSTDIAKVPAAKLELGVPAYGRHWRRSADGSPCPDGALTTNSVTTATAPGLARDHGVAPRRDPAGSGEMTVTWSETVTGIHTWSPVVAPPVVVPPVVAGTVAVGAGGAPALRLGPPPTIVTCTVNHTVFYPDGPSIAAKAKVALDRGWGGIVIWAASYETSGPADTAVYDALRAIP